MTTFATTVLPILFTTSVLLWIYGERKNVRKARISAFIMAILCGISSVVVFISVAAYCNYTHEHYSRGYTRIRNMLEMGQIEEVKGAIGEFETNQPEPGMFSLERSLYIQKAMEGELRQKGSEQALSPAPRDR